MLNSIICPILFLHLSLCTGFYYRLSALCTIYNQWWILLMLSTLKALITLKISTASPYYDFTDSFWPRNSKKSIGMITEKLLLHKVPLSSEKEQWKHMLAVVIWNFTLENGWMERTFSCATTFVTHLKILAELLLVKSTQKTTYKPCSKEATINHSKLIAVFNQMTTVFNQITYLHITLHNK